MSAVAVPPHSYEAEQAVLGSLLMDSATAWDQVGDLLVDSDFYRHEHRLIFAAIYALASAIKPADVITVFERLQNRGQAEDAGGLSYLNALGASVATPANARHYAEVVRDHAIRRELSNVGSKITQTAASSTSRSVRQLLDEAEASVLGVGSTGRRGGDTFQGAAALTTQLVDRVQELHDNGAEEVTGVRTGFVDLDRQTAGLQKGDLIILAARPSMGKTALALNIAERVAVREGLPVLVFSMEMTADQLMLRLAGSLSRVDQQRIRTGRLRDDTNDWSRFTDAIEALGEAPLFIDDTGSLTVTELRARARRKARSLGRSPALIVIDYLQLMAGEGDENRSTELSAVSRGLKSLAKELQCPVIALSQLNRGVEQRTDKRPMMSDLRDSGAIEQDADVVLLIYRDDYYNREASTRPGVAELIIAKQRNGPTCVVDLAFAKAITRFESMAVP